MAVAIGGTGVAAEQAASQIATAAATIRRTIHLFIYILLCKDRISRDPAWEYSNLPSAALYWITTH